MAKDLKLQYRFKIHNILKLTEGYLLGEILAWKYSFDINICKILKSGKMFNWDSVNTWAHEWSKDITPCEYNSGQRIQTAKYGIEIENYGMESYSK